MSILCSAIFPGKRSQMHFFPLSSNLSSPPPFVMLSQGNEVVLSMDVIAYLQVLLAFAVVVQLLFHDVSIPDDVINDMVMQTIEEHHLPQLTGKYRRPPPSDMPKYPRIQYDYKRVEESVLSGWVGVAPQFLDRQFQ